MLSQHPAGRDLAAAGAERRRPAPSPTARQEPLAEQVSSWTVDNLGIVLAELRRQFGKRWAGAPEGEGETDERKWTEALDNPERRGLRVGDDLVDGLARPIRDARGVQPRRPDRNRLGREEVREDNDQRAAIDDPVAVGAEARVFGEARPPDRGTQPAEQIVVAGG